ncbi:MAG: hypothetical protein B6I35_14295 [Anaerolineaceae bacterium 4572_32.2]|nr:MAG: hypothetical protein B6I35_14295 [Anaerolineaceae bacterium 4572_32.2]
MLPLLSIQLFHNIIRFNESNKFSGMSIVQVCGESKWRRAKKSNPCLTNLRGRAEQCRIKRRAGIQDNRKSRSLEVN